IDPKWHTKCLGYQPRPTRIEIMKTLDELDGLPALKSQPGGILNSIPSLITLGIVGLVTTLVCAAQPDPPNNSGQPRETTNQSSNEAPAQHFDRSFESFAPAVKKVAPAVVRIVTALRSKTPADLTTGA